jgi:hypothetical protein
VAALRAALENDVKECAAWCDVDQGCAACYREMTCEKRLVLSTSIPPDLARLRRENEALKEAFARLANDGAIRLRIAEEAPPNNMRCGQVREIRWWLMTLEKVRDADDRP